MTAPSYRDWRRKLARAIPASGLVRFTLYVAAVDLLVYLCDAVTERVAPRHAYNLGGWVFLLTLALLVLLSILGLRWFRRRFMWRLRNRLIVTYVFIGVIPLVLVLAMALVAGYLFAGQFATFLVTSDLDSELKSLGAANSTVAAELNTLVRQGGLGQNRTIPALQGFRPDDPRYTSTEISAWYNGQGYVLHAVPGRGGQPLQQPGWMADEFLGIVLDNHALYLRALDTVATPGGNVVVISSMPLDQALLERLAAHVGEITLYPSNVIRFRSGDAIEMNPESQPGVAAAPTAQGDRARTDSAVSGGVMPPRTRALDREVAFATPFSISSWQTGEKRTIALRVGTRLSLLYGRLFMTMVEFGSVIKGLLIGIAVFFAVIELIALFIGLGLTRTMTRSVAELYNATQHINRGDLKHRIKVKARDQLAALETSFNSMSESLERLIAEQKEKQRLEHELAIAQEVQAQLFPTAQTELQSLEVHGVCRPARTVSGDYYDFLSFGPDRLALAVGDISGKGISAALLMATIHSAVRAYEFGRVPLLAAHLAIAGTNPGGSAPVLDSVVPDHHFSPAQVMALLNRQLYLSTPAEKYATLFLGVYSGDARALTYSNAGHLPPIIIGNDGGLRRLDTPGLVIGLFDEQGYEERTVHLQPGDIFLAFSDGVTEPENEFGEFGEQRLVEIVRDHRHLPLARVSEVVLSAVADWIGDREQPDDVTLVLARTR